MLNHTPGPWVHSYKPNGTSFRIVAPRIHVISEDVQGRDEQETEANALLISLGPEMLERLVAGLAVFPDTVWAKKTEKLLARLTVK